MYRVHMPPEAHEALRDVMYSGCLTDGPTVRSFEEALRGYLGNRNLITAGDVSSAITLALYIAGVRPGDEVLAAPGACLVTNMPILNLFAKVVWCDVDPQTGNIDPNDIEKHITPRTRAVVYAHWGGDVADIDRINAVCRRRGLRVVEVASEALGAEYRKVKIGNTGTDFVVFSFQAVRHINTIDGAAITFANRDEAEHAQWLRRCGIHQPTFRDEWGEINPTSDIPVSGFNTYMNSVAASIGLTQMAHLKKIVKQHYENGSYYDQALANIPGIGLVKRLPESRSAYWVYTFFAERRDDLLHYLRERRVYASKVHLRNDLYSCFGTGRMSYSSLDSFDSRYLCLPSGWWVSEEDREYIVDCISQGW